MGIILPLNKKGDITYSLNYWGITNDKTSKINTEGENIEEVK